MITWFLAVINAAVLVYLAYDAAKNRRKMHRLFDKTATLAVESENLIMYYVKYFDFEKYRKDRQGRGHNTLYDQRTLLEDAYQNARKELWAEYLDQTGKEIKRPGESIT